MCLAVPGRIVSVDNSGPLRMARTDFGGVHTDICVEWLPEAGVGDYILAHVGTALTLLTEEDALETLKALEELGEIEVGRSDTEERNRTEK